MNKTTLFGIIFAVLVLSVLVYFGFYYTSAAKTDWTQYIQQKNKTPYGTTVFKSMIEKSYGNRINYITKPIRNQLPKNTEIPHQYIYIGEHFYIHPLDIKALLYFVEQGNNVFISAHAFQHFLFDSIHYRYWRNKGEPKSFFYGNVESESPFISSLQDTRLVQNVTVLNQYQIQYTVDSNRVDKRNINIPSSTGNTFLPKSMVLYFWTDSIKKIPGVIIQDYALYSSSSNGTIRVPIGVKINLGKGSLHLHTQPDNFSNYFIQDTEGFLFLNTFFHSFKRNELWWDNYSTSTPPFYPKEKTEHETILEYILNNVSLRNAWYLLLISGILYIVFYGKRRQRSMMVIEPKRNATMDYILTTGRMFFSSGNKEQLVQLTYKQMNMTLFNTYGFTIKDSYLDQLPVLAVKTRVSEEEWKYFIHTGRKYSTPGYDISESDFKKFNQIAHYIYTKIQS